MPLSMACQESPPSLDFKMVPPVPTAKAVEVSRLALDLGAAAGVSLPVLVRRDKSLGVQALAGPRLRLTRVHTRVRSDGRSTWPAW